MTGEATGHFVWTIAAHGYGSRIDERDDMIMRPAWRSRTTPGRRGAAVGFTFALLVAAGTGLMWLAIVVLRGLGAPGVVAAAPWWLPTAGALAWAMRNPKPGEVTEDGDDSWLMLAIRTVLVGVDESRARPLRAITAVVFGAPVAWGLVIVAALILTGVL